jgi:glucose-1-phosphate adenylyltransferase
MSCLTRHRPKPLLPFAGHFRVIDFALSNALDSGARRVYVITQHHGNQVADYLEKGWQINGYPRFATAVSAPADRPYRGTTDAATRNVDLFGDRHREVLVLSADHVYQMDYGDLVRFHREQGADVTIATTVVPARRASSLGVVIADDDGRILHLYEKPENPSALPGAPDTCLVSMGIYVFRPESLASLSSDDLPDLGRSAIPELIRTARVCAYRFDQRAPQGYRYWADVGTLDSYFTSHQDLLDGGIRFLTEGTVRSGMMDSITEASNS